MSPFSWVGSTVSGNCREVPGLHVLEVVGTAEGWQCQRLCTASAKHCLFIDCCLGNAFLWVMMLADLWWSALCSVR